MCYFITPFSDTVLQFYCAAHCTFCRKRHPFLSHTVCDIVEEPSVLPYVSVDAPTKNLSVFVCWTSLRRSGQNNRQKSESYDPHTGTGSHLTTPATFQSNSITNGEAGFSVPNYIRNHRTGPGYFPQNVLPSPPPPHNAHPD